MSQLTRKERQAMHDAGLSSLVKVKAGKAFTTSKYRSDKVVTANTNWALNSKEASKCRRGNRK